MYPMKEMTEGGGINLFIAVLDHKISRGDKDLRGLKKPRPNRVKTKTYYLYFYFY